MFTFIITFKMSFNFRMTKKERFRLEKLAKEAGIEDSLDNSENSS